MPRFFITLSSSGSAIFDASGADYDNLAAASTAARSALHDLSKKHLGSDRPESLTATIRDDRHILSVETLSIKCSTTPFKFSRP